MQSSRMKAEKLPLSAPNHSEALSFSGESGGRPTRARCSVAVDKAEAAELGLRLAFAAAPEDQARRRADSSGQQKSDAERPCSDDRQVRLHLGADVRCFPDACAQAFGRAGELLPLRLDVLPNLLDGARVATGHRSSTPPSSASPRGSPAQVQ